MKDFIRVMKAMRQPNRVKILKVLQHGELCIGEIQKVWGGSQPTVSRNACYGN